MMAMHPGLPELDAERSAFGVERYRLGFLVEISARRRSAADPNPAEVVGAAWDDIRQAVAALQPALQSADERDMEMFRLWTTNRTLDHFIV
jgi:hypothetical protein